DALAARVRVLHPQARDLKVQYGGRFRAVSVTETIPQALPGDPTHRASAWVETTLKLMPGRTVGGSYGMSMGAHGSLVLPAFPDQYGKLPTFVDFRMPAALEGTSALYGPVFGRDPAYQAAYAELCRRVVATADQVQAGTYQNPIEGLLAAQGET